MDVENLNKSELLTLFSMLEGELEARDLVIEALKAQQRDAFVLERYGKFSLTDPFLALQRDGEAARGCIPEGGSLDTAFSASPLAVLKLVMGHCKRMQEKMMAQLAAAERQHRKVIKDLEEEKRRHAQDTAEGEDLTCMLEKERERLLQQLDFERAQVKQLEKELKRLTAQVEDGQAQHKELSSTLARAQEEGRRAADLQAELESERKRARVELESERKRAEVDRNRAEGQMEADRQRAEAQLAESDAEREGLRARLRREESRCRELQAQVELLQGELAGEKKAPPSKSPLTEVAGRTPIKDPNLSRVNGHHSQKDAENAAERPSQDTGQESGGVSSPVHLYASLSPSSTASSSLTSSPCSSPVLTKRLLGAGAVSPSYQLPYQSSVTQRFQAARHKFQAQVDHEQGASAPVSPHDLSPPGISTAELSSAKQLARNTVTQVLSRFTSQQGGAKPLAPNSSPFGTDYRNVASPSPAGKPSSPLSPGGKPGFRSERTHPPPVPPKKAGIAQPPGSPGPPGRSSHFPELSAMCGLTTSQEGAKEPDLVASSSS